MIFLPSVYCLLSSDFFLVKIDKKYEIQNAYDI